MVAPIFSASCGLGWRGRLLALTRSDRYDILRQRSPAAQQSDERASATPCAKTSLSASTLTVAVNLIKQKGNSSNIPVTASAHLLY
jgi:hypothetical protein